MDTIGIICEYNPLHSGHKKQIDLLRGENSAVVCLMSGNFVQRGHPAIIDKTIRAEAAIRCGADLVLELPAVYALSSAEGFAAGGVKILSGFCSKLCFGAETADRDALMNTAKALLSEEFPPLLRAHLEQGKSFPAARQCALEEMGLDGTLLESPNNILAVEYCKAILTQKSNLEPMPIHRGGDYHDTQAQLENPSATAIRSLMMEHRYWKSYVPGEAVGLFEQARLHHISAGERAILARLRTMTDEDFEALPYGSEGLWRKLMHACRDHATLDEIIEATKSKRYTRSRIDRMIMCAYLGLTAEDLTAPVPYVRVLALNDRGRVILKQAREHGIFLNAGDVEHCAYGQKEQQMGDLYGLFALEGPERPGVEANRRIYYHKG